MTKLISGGAMCRTFCHAVILPALQVKSQKCYISQSPHHELNDHRLHNFLSFHQGCIIPPGASRGVCLLFPKECFLGVLFLDWCRVFLKGCHYPLWSVFFPPGVSTIPPGVSIIPSVLSSWGRYYSCRDVYNSGRAI